MRVFYKPNLWDGESTREPSLHVVLPGPAGEGVEGPQHHVWDVPGRSRPLHAKFSGQRYLKIVQSSASKVPAYSFMIKNFFSNRMKRTKTPATSIAINSCRNGLYRTLETLIFEFFTCFLQIKLQIKGWA